MGTRGFVGFVVDGTEKIAYNHWDSYPDGLGSDVLEWLRQQVQAQNEGAVRTQATALTAVDEDAHPTAEELERFREYHDPGVSGGDDWYALLRGTQGKPGEILRAGFYVDASKFPLDSLFCEWGYLVDLDDEMFEVYRGFQKSPATEGRWADPLARPDDSGYYAVQLVVRFPFKSLPSEDEFFAHFQDDED